MRWEQLAQIRSPDDGFWDTLVVLSLTEAEAISTEAPRRERPVRRRPQGSPSESRPEHRPTAL
jgi:hypothetical protein